MLVAKPLSTLRERLLGESNAATRVCAGGGHMARIAAKTDRTRQTHYCTCTSHVEPVVRMMSRDALHIPLQEVRLEEELLRVYVMAIGTL